LDKRDNAFLQLGEIAYRKISTQIQIKTEEEAISTAYACMPIKFIGDDEKVKWFLDGFVDAWKEAQADEEVTLKRKK